MAWQALDGILWPPPPLAVPLAADGEPRPDQFDRYCDKRAVKRFRYNSRKALEKRVARSKAESLMRQVAGQRAATERREAERQKAAGKEARLLAKSERAVAAIHDRKRGEVAAAKRAALFTSPLFASECAPSSQVENARRAQQYHDASQCLPAATGAARSSQSVDWQLHAAWLKTVNRLTDPREAK